MKFQIEEEDNFQIHQFDIQMDNLVDLDLLQLLEHSFLFCLDRIQCYILKKKVQGLLLLKELVLQKQSQ